jgi:type VI secretion system protein ImpL
MQRLDHDTQGQRVLSWSAQGNPEASVTMYPPEPETPPPQPVPAPASAPTASAAGQNGAAAQPAPPPAPPAPPPPPPARISAEGPWAFFRLMDKADKQNAGPQTIRATFRSGPHWVTLLIQLPTGDSPFGRGGMWTFRCPAAL